MCAKRKASAIKLVDFAKSFYTDLEMDGMLYAVFIRSPVNSGIIKSITHPKLPSGYKLITALDIPGSKVVKILDCEIPIFAETNILYKGEPLGMIVGPNQVVLQELLGEIVIKFVTEDSVCEKKIENTTIKEDDFVESNISEDILEKEKSEILTNDEIVNNINVEDKIEVEENDIEKSIQKDVSEKILFHRSVSFGGDVEQIFSESEIQIEGNYSSVVSSCYNGEPIGALASYKQNVLSIYSPVTWFSQARRTISAVTGIELQQIEIKKTLSAGDNSQKVWYSTILLAQLALATMLCGKPVKIFFSNEEQMSYFARSMPVAVNNRTSINSDGSISSMIISIAVDTGSYNPFVKEIIDRLVIASTGCYFPANCKIEAYAVSSRAAPVSVNLQRIDSPVFFAIENHIQQICHKIGFLPDEFRLKNSIFTKNFPFKININGIDKVFQSVLKLID